MSEPENVTEREKIARELEQFARDYVEKWGPTQGEGAKSEGWAILQAAAHIRGNA